jgi:diguanylate cyclase (GGDEF)-like protein
MIRSALAGLPIVIGSLALLGWLSDLPGLERLYGPLVTVDPATAMGLLLSGLALWLNYVFRSRPGNTIAVIVLSALVLVGGLLKLSDLLISTDIAIDTRLFAAEMAKAGLHNRMAPSAALSFVLVPVATMLAMARSRAAVIASQLISTFCALIVGLALVGYCYGVTPLYGSGTLTPMSLATAFALSGLCTGILAIRRHEGLLTCICNSGPAGRMSRTLLPASVLSVVGVGALRLFGIHTHLYPVEFGVPLSVVINIAMLLPLFWGCARVLFAEDLKRGAAENQLRHRASHDLLTGLANRAVFFDRLQQRIDLMKRRGGPPFAVFYLDLDGFKQINDFLGHEAGDQFLIQSADVLRQCTRGTDTVARIGGDEFAILFEEIEHVGAMEYLAQRILQAFPKQFGDGAGLPVGVSIGMAASRVEYVIPEDILRCADIALYMAKASGKGRSECFDGMANAA